MVSMFRMFFRTLKSRAVSSLADARAP
jgi:hypothetical protein